MIPIFQEFLQDVYPFLQPICFFCAWILCLMLIWTVVTAIADVVKRSKLMHQIPCSNCQYFTNNYRLKCTVRPNLASTEQAINCPDYYTPTN
jgi:hypothetical protein